MLTAFAAFILASVSWQGLTAWVVQLGVFMGVLTTTALAISAFVSKTGLGRPIKWVWNRIVGRPVSGFFDKRDELRSLYLETLMDNKLAPIKAELQTNGGSSLKDAVKRIEARGDTYEAGLAKLEAGQADLRAAVLRQK